MAARWSGIWAFLFWGVAVWMIAIPVAAVTGPIDDVPGATLLIPHLEVDLDACAGNGITTEVTVSNTGSADAFAHVTLWTDLSVPVFNFNVYLAPGSTETLDLRGLLCQGSLPQTDPPASAPASCVTTLPPGNLPQVLIDHIADATTGRASLVLSGMCSGADLGDNIARGYLTVDAVLECTLAYPSGPGYASDLDMRNQLQGSVRLVDPDRGLDVTSMAVPLEADPVNLGPGSATFYQRYSGSLDAREPLPSSVTASYDFGPAVDTRFFLWRDGLDPQPFACGSPPPPLSSASVLVAADDAVVDEALLQPAPFETNAFDFSDLGAAAANDGTSSGEITVTLPSQAWIQGGGYDPRVATPGIPGLSMLGLVFFALALAAAAVLKLS